MTAPTSLIFLPTLNEGGTIESIIQQIIDLDLGADILVIDDGSSDGTDKMVEKLGTRYPSVSLIERGARLGVGSAHIHALRLAKERKYGRLITMDADFSHQPSDIPRFIEAAKAADIVVGSRFERTDSLKDWNLFRKGMTHLGHFLTRLLLSMPYDASGGFRVYAIDRIPQDLIDNLKSANYDFFFESLTMMHRRGLSIAEVPIDLPARVYGHSKMQLKHILGGFFRLVLLSYRLKTKAKA